MKFYKLGKLPKDTIEFFKSELLKQKVYGKPYQWILFDEFLNKEFLKIFSNTELKVQWRKDGSRPIQKAFYSDPGHGYKIHKDGISCKSALNIVLSCNSSDWVRWYDEEYINKLYKLEVTNKTLWFSRDINIINYESVPFTHELKNSIGDVYVLDVETYHSFKCIGTVPRIVLQTKFDGYPNFETIKNSLIKNSFHNLIQDDNGAV